MLARTRDALAGTLEDARAAAAHLESSERELQLLHARRFAYLLADLAEAGLLVDEAAWAYDRDGDARKVVIAERFTKRKLAPPLVRGILDDDRTAIDLFEPVVRYGRIEADALA
jgi:hypothetical protein